jgi:hypothetical protein
VKITLNVLAFAGGWANDVVGFCDRQRTTRTDRLDDADHDVTVGAVRDGQVGDLSVGPARRARLCLVEGRPALLGPEFEQVRRGVVGFGERLGSGAWHDDSAGITPELLTRSRAQSAA